MIDDNGDGRGSSAKMFRGVRTTGKAKDGAKIDGKFATKVTLSPTGQAVVLTDEELQQRATLEQQLDDARKQKDDIETAEYQKLIEPILVELARIYRAAESRQSD